MLTPEKKVSLIAMNEIIRLTASELVEYGSAGGT